jgi:hypothetical protein
VSADAAAALPHAEGELAPDLDPMCFVFGGVAFEMCPAPGLSWSLGAEHRLFAGAYATSPVAGQVHCVVSPAPELDHEGFTREIRWSWSDDVARISAGRVRAELRQLAPARYAATALVAPHEAGCSALVTALTGAVVSREGGFVVHAAGVEIDGRAVLFVGPSGAGKTTAANHSQGARWMARDRAAVYPTPLGWYAAGMAGGDPIDLPRAAGHVFPLGAIFRVQKARGRPAARAASAVQVIRVLRESVQAVAEEPSEEGARIERLAALGATCPTMFLETVLGAPLIPVLRSALGRSR